MDNEIIKRIGNSKHADKPGSYLQKGRQCGKDVEVFKKSFALLTFGLVASLPAKSKKHKPPDIHIYLLIIAR